MKTKLFPAALFLLMAGLGSLRAAVFEPLNGFAARPANPAFGSLLRYSDGNFYGTSTTGGINGNGTLFKVSPAGELTTLVHFAGNLAPKGIGPRGGLVSDGAGSLWGTTAGGGASNVGTIFKYDVAARVLTTVAEFTGNSGLVKGATPVCTLVDDGAGSFWGTTLGGGSAGIGGLGTVFKIGMTGNAFATVVEFTDTGAAPGRSPYTGLTADGAGNLWGVTQIGGTSNLGTLFKVRISDGAMTSMNSFAGGAGGAKPYGTLLLDSGFLWGTTFESTPLGGGTIFKIDAVTGDFSVAAQLTTATSGLYPYAGLTRSGAFLWGSTTSGPGAVFKFDPSNNSVTKVAAFDTSTGTVPHPALVSDGAGSLWGTTNLSGALASAGTVFKINTTSGALSVVTVLGDTIKGKSPDAGLAADGNGWLWGTTQSGGANNFGTVYKVDPVSGVMSVVINFSGTTGAALGSNPLSTLLLVGNDFWGTTSTGGVGGRGTIFKVNRNTGAFTSVLTFSGANIRAKGMTPSSALTTTDGGLTLWGTTYEGGANNMGTIFNFSTTGATLPGSVNTLVEFAGANGQLPRAGLVSDGAGAFWGCTSAGGPGNFGTIFKITEAGVFQTMINFTGSAGAAPGRSPTGTLVADGRGFLWGTTTFGGASDRGTVYKISIGDGGFSPMISFNGNTVPGGANPAGALASDGRGNLWGCTSAGPTGSFGTLFAISAQYGSFGTVAQFSGSGGTFPGASPSYGALLLHTDGHFYGTTSGGGVTNTGYPAGYGQIFRIYFGPAAVTGTADNITTTGATLHGTVNGNGSMSEVYFDLSTSPTLDAPLHIFALSFFNGPSTGIVEFPEPISATLTGLAPDTTYYYRAGGLNSENVLPQTGAIFSFKTAPRPSFATWAAGYGLSGANASSNADPDHDGIPNAIEYVLAGNPNSSAAIALPTALPSGPNLVFTFNRADNSETPDLSLSVEVSTDLASWPTVFAVGATTAASSSGVTVQENGTAADTITVTIPKGAATRLFARLKASVTP